MIQQEENDMKLRAILGELHDAPEGMEADYATVWKKLEEKLEKKPAGQMSYMWKAAAVIILLVGSVLFLLKINNYDSAIRNKDVVVKNELLSPLEKPVEINTAQAVNEEVHPTFNVQRKKAGKTINVDQIVSDSEKISRDIHLITKAVTNINDSIVQEPAITNPTVVAKTNRLKILHINEMISAKEIKEMEERLQLSISNELIISKPDHWYTFPFRNKKYKSKSGPPEEN